MSAGPERRRRAGHAPRARRRLVRRQRRAPNAARSSRRQSMRLLGDMAVVFLLSPAYCGGRRAAMLLNPASEMALAVRVRAGTLTLGEAFAFMSGVYFRGKITYAAAFERPDGGTFVITPTRGLQPPDAPVTPQLIREFASVD